MGLIMYDLCFTVFICIATFVDSASYIVYMNQSAMPKPFANVPSWYVATLQSISGKSLTHISAKKLIYSYTYAIQGFSATLTLSELEEIKKTHGYLSSTRDAPVQLLTTHSPEFLGLNSRSGAWPVSSYGKDVIVGVVDTGVWPESKSFSDEGMEEIPSRWRGECQVGTEFNSSMCNKKLIGARYFNRGFLKSFPKENISMDSARDTFGHGTHTSSTVGGNFVKGASYFGYGMGTAKGVAPHARLAIYKTFWNSNSKGVSSDILAAIDQAIVDGVDILSLSLSSTDFSDWYEDPISIASFTAVEQGVFVSMACGNDGPTLQTVANTMPWVLTVAAGTMDRDFRGLLTLGNGISISGTSLYHGNFSSTQIPLVFMNECYNMSQWNVTRKQQIGVSICNGSLPSSYVYRSSVAGVFITDQGDFLERIVYTFPFIILNLEDGKVVTDYIRAQGAQASGRLTFGKTRLGMGPAPMVSYFSSRGPAFTHQAILKPDLMAPGQKVLASWPKDVRLLDGSVTKFNVVSGTSMACPHAAGLAAILKGVHPDWSMAAIRSAMMTTSSITDNTFNPIQEIGAAAVTEATPLAMGAGHISPNKALNPGLVYDMDMGDYINLLCGLNFTRTQIQMISRSSIYNCSSPTLDINYPSFIATFTYQINSTGKVLKVFRRTLTSVTDGMAVYRANFTGLDDFNITVEPRSLSFSKKGDKKSYKLIIQSLAFNDRRVRHGFLSWVSADGYYVVRSPVVVMGQVTYVEQFTPHNSQSSRRTLKQIGVLSNVVLILLLVL